MVGSGQAFWDFSVSIYGKPRVAEACLWLQDELGLDVNVLLFCCWHGRVVGELDDTEFRRARDLSSMWSNDVVKPLRGVRRWMKTTGCSDGRIDRDGCMKVRERVKTTELEAERLQQYALARMVNYRVHETPTADVQLAAATANVRHYLLAENALLDRRAIGRLKTVLLASIDGADENTVAAGLSGH